MSPKAILIFCAQMLLAQSAFSQCTTLAAVDATGIAGPFGWPGAAFGPALGYDGLAGPFGYDGFASPLAYDGLAGLGAPFAYDGFGGWAGRGFGFDGLYPAIASAIEFTPTTGGGLTVTSASAIPPIGISVISENAYEGIVAITGEVPFVGTTGMEGVLPTSGAGAVQHNCGNGLNAMISETTGFAPGFAAATIAPGAFASAAFAPGLAIAPGFAPAAYGGCGRGYIL